MTTTAREDRTTRPPRSHAGRRPSITPPPKLRRRPALVVAAVVVDRPRLPARRLGLERDHQHPGGSRRASTRSTAAR